MKKLKVAIIGCGSIASMHLTALCNIEEVQLVAVCDINEQRVLQVAKKYQVNAYTDYKSMFQCETLDAVHICLPHYLHTIVAKEAFRNGIHVMCEKPMSITYEDAIEAVELAEECQVQYGIIFQNRYNTHAQGVKQRIIEKKLGDVHCARAVLTWNRPEDYYNTSDWRGTWDKEGGGVLINQAIHTLDLAHWFINDVPIEVQSSVHNRMHSNIEVEDTAEGLIKYQNGALLSFYFTNNYLVNESIEVRLSCEHGKVILSTEEANIFYHDGSRETINNISSQSAALSCGKPYWGTRHAEQIRQFYLAVLGKELLQISGKEALKTQKLVCDIYKNRLK